MKPQPMTPTRQVRLSAGERAARGRAARTRAPRSAHSEFAPSRHRADPVDVIERQSARRVRELVPLRYGRMSESPFRFYRGAAAVMAGDLATTADTGLRTQLCGDAHMLNFRLLASAERNLIFDINDFDETLPGPWEWDLKRLATSLVIAGRENGFTDAQRSRTARDCVRSYREHMHRYARMRLMDVWYARSDAAQIKAVAAEHLHARGRRRLDRSLAKARGRDSLQAYGRLSTVIGGERRIAADPPLLVPLGDLLPEVERAVLEEKITSLLLRYRASLRSDRRHLLSQFTPVDMARKVVGVGSVGTRCWIVLLLGRDDTDPLFLQAKEADTSVLAPHLGDTEFATQGERVVAGQRLMQSAGDILLGWERVEGIDGAQRDFYLRQLRDWKLVPDATRMTPKAMRLFGALCGGTLARAHARSGDRIAIASYLGGSDSFDRAVAAFAERYADQNERDHQALLDAVRRGRVIARRD